MPVGLLISVVVAILLAGAVILVLVDRSQPENRGQALRSVAASLGLDTVPVAGVQAELAELPFLRSAPTPGAGALSYGTVPSEFALTGSIADPVDGDEVEVRVLDTVTGLRDVSGREVPGIEDEPSRVVTAIALSLPEPALTTTTLAASTFVAADGVEPSEAVALSSEIGDLRLHVDDGLAADWLPHDLLTWMAGLNGRYRLELAGPWLVLLADRRPPGDLPLHLELARRARRLLNGHVDT